MSISPKLIFAEPVTEQKKVASPLRTTVLFIDVDGVLFGEYGGFLQLRPFVNSFLNWAQSQFRCYWLTAWSESNLEKLFSELYFYPQIKYAHWRNHKTEAVIELCSDGDFYWLEDGLMQVESEWIESNGLINRYIEVDHTGRDGLDVATLELCLRAGIPRPPYITEATMVHKAFGFPRYYDKDCNDPK